MSEYNAPLRDMSFVIRDLAGLDQILKLPAFDSITAELGLDSLER